MKDIQKPATTADAKKQLLSMFQGFPMYGDADDLKLEFDAYWGALADLPPGAIIAACKDGSRGKLTANGRRPTVSQLYHRAEHYARPRHSTRPRQEMPRQIPADEQRRVCIGLGQLAKEIAATTERERQARPESPHYEAGDPLPPLSDEAKRIFERRS